MDPKSEKEQKELERRLGMVRELARNPQFNEWVELIVKPTIQSLEADLSNADKLSEVVIRAKLKHLQSLKFLFEDVFKQIKG